MKLIFNHDEGVMTPAGNCLLEIECLRENETSQFMFENGWLPYLNDRWYQCRSSRLKLAPISSRRKRELSKITFLESGDADDIITRAKKFGKFREDWARFYMSLPNYTFYMDNVAMGILNFFDDQIFYTTLVWDRDHTTNSYGTLSYYHLIDKFKGDYEYMYISEYYDEFAYKQSLPGFEYWSGSKWLTVDVSV